MRHYDYVEWLLYKNNLISKEKQVEMEEHLYNCDDCMKVFLSSIDDMEIEEAGILVPDDFSSKIMSNIKNVRPIKKPINKKKNFNDLFLYYISVASVAIFFTAGGIFTKMVEVVPQISIGMSIEESRVRTDTIYNLSESITNRTSEFINNFGRKN
ncbi:MAG: hypothetical protein AB2375_00765 [Tissierellaceae bacterium]